MLFNGTSSTAKTSGLGGVASAAATARTIAAIIRLNSTSAWRNIGGIKTSADLNVWSLGRSNSSGNWVLEIDGAVIREGPSSATGHQYIAVDKAAGSATARFHKQVYGTDATVAHSNTTSGATGNHTRTPAKISLGEYESNDWFDGDVFVYAIWNRQLADWEHEWLASSLAAWLALAPDFLVIELGAALPTAVPDLSGNGASLSTLTNLAVSTASMPVSIGGEVLPLTHPGGGAQTIVIGQALETDTALVITPRKSKAIGQALETDTAQAITRAKTRAVGQATETNTATVLARLKAKAIGQALETDTAQPVGKAKAKATGQAVETDTAGLLTRVKTRLLGQASETDTAQPITASGAKVIAVNQAVETDTAQPVGKAKAKAIGQAVETDTAGLLTRVKTRLLGQASETDTATAMGKAKSKLLGQALETDIAQAITALGGLIVATLLKLRVRDHRALASEVHDHRAVSSDTYDHPADSSEHSEH